MKVRSARCVRTVTAAMVAVGVLGLQGCSGGGGSGGTNEAITPIDDDADGDGGTTGTTDGAADTGSADDAGTTDGTGDTGGDGGTDGTTDPGIPDALLSDVPVFITAECGSIPAETTAFSNDRNAPSELLVGQVVKGRIDETSVTNKRHYWNVDLPVGNYHVIVDGQNVDDTNVTHGIEINEIDTAGEEVVRLLRGVAGNDHSRAHAFVNIEAARTVRMAFEPVNNQAVDYSVAIFGNGTPVPSPFFEDCPNITTFGLATTQAFTLAESNRTGIDDEAWFSIDLNAGDYVLTSSATTGNGGGGNIVYRFESRDQFGQQSRLERVLRVSGTTAPVPGSGDVNLTESGHMWFKSSNEISNVTLAMEFAVTPD